MKDNELYLVYGSNPKKMVLEILERIEAEKDIPRKEALIGIKPNLVVAKPADSGATTHPELVAGIIEYLQSKGFRNIAILEGSWVGDRTQRAFKICGYEDLSKRYGVPLVDLQKDSSRSFDVNGMQLNICNKVTELDYLINVPVLKGHCQTYLTCALKNMKGCIPDSEKRRFHTMGLHKPIAHLNKAVKQHLVIVDGMMGDLNFEEGGNPVQMNRIIVGKDPVLIDSYALKLMGLNEEEVPYVKMAEKLGVGSTDLSTASLIEINKDHCTERISFSRKVRELAKYVQEDNACSACYGSVIQALERLSERGMLSKLRSKIYIGQSYKGKNMEGVGIGVCTNGFDHCVKGCPPTASDIVAYLEKNILSR